MSLFLYYYSDVNNPKLKPGRPLVGEKPMTASERKKASRASICSKGVSEVTFSLREEYITNLDYLAECAKMSRSKMLMTLLEFNLGEIKSALTYIQNMKKENRSNQELVSGFHNSLDTSLPLIHIDKLKEVFNI